MDLSALIFAALKSAKTANERIDNLPLPMVFKGSLGTGGTISTLPTASSSNEGYVYIVITDGTYAGQSAKAGDLFVSDGTSWVLVPSADEPSVIDDSVTSTALTWSSEKISGLFDSVKVKSFTYTGTGSSTNNITFPVKPTFILSIFGVFDANNNIQVMPFFYGQPNSTANTVPIDLNAGNGNRSVSISYNDKVITLQGTNTSRALNIQGEEYTVCYI